MASTSAPLNMRVKVTVDGERFVADYTASDRQARGPVNATRGVTISATYNALYQLADKAIPRNAGCYRKVEVLTRPGTCLDVAFPAPSVGGNTETQPRIVFLVLGALAAAIPERVSASEGCTACNFLIGGENPKTGEYFAHYHFEASGWGGRPTADGNDVQNHIIGNCRITPIEVFETRFPVTVLSYELIPDSGGAAVSRRPGEPSRDAHRRAGDAHEHADGLQPAWAVATVRRQARAAGKGGRPQGWIRPMRALH